MHVSARFIMEQWPLDAVVVGGSLHDYGDRDTLAIDSAQGGFILKMYENECALSLGNPSPEEIRRCLYVFDYLQERQFGHIPTLVKTRAADTFWRSDSHTAYLIERIEGGRPPDTPSTWRELGRVAAGLNAHKDFPYHYPIDSSGVIEELKALSEGYPFARSFLDVLGMLDPILGPQPASLIHTEINTANSFLGSDGRIVLLDLDGCGTGPTALETGYPLITCFVEDSAFHHDWASAFYQGYTGGAGVADEAKERVFAAALLHGLRHVSFAPRFTPEELVPRWEMIQYALAHKDELLAAISTGPAG